MSVTKTRSPLAAKATRLARKAHEWLGIPSDAMLEESDNGGLLWARLTSERGVVHVQLSDRGQALDLVVPAEQFSALADMLKMKLPVDAALHVGDEWAISFRYGVEGNQSSMPLDRVVHVLEEHLGADLSVRIFFQPYMGQTCIDKGLRWAHDPQGYQLGQ